MSTKYIASNWRLPNKAGVDSYLNDNYGLTFDGSEYIEGTSEADTLNNLTALSVSMWINQTDVASFKYYLSIGNNGGSPTDFLELYSHGTASRSFNVEGSIATAGFQSFDFSSFVSNSTWFHLTLVWDSTQSTATDRIKIYIDGVLRGSLSGVTSTFDTNGEIKIGRTWRNTSNTFDGSISELAVFNYALSESQISTLYGSSSLGSASPLALKPAPVAYYPLGDNSSGNPLTQPNEAVEDASVFDFPASNDFISIGSTTLGINTAIAISAWFKTSVNTGYGVIINEDNAGTKRNWGLLRKNDDINFIIYHDDTGVNATTIETSTINVSDNNWHHVVGTWDGTTNANSMKVYFDGIEVGQTTPSSTGINTEGSAPWIGNSTIQTGGYFNWTGQLSNIQVWNTALSSSEITTLYNSGVPLLTGTQPQASNLKAWYKLDQSANWDVSGSGYWDIPDASGNGNDGISSGMTSANLVLSDLTRNLPYDSYSFNFDAASSDYIQLASSSTAIVDWTQPYSISLWVNYTTSLSFDLMATFGVETGSSLTTRYIMIGGNLDYLFTGVGDTDGGQTSIHFNIGSNLNNGEWHHLVYVGDGSSGDYPSVYIDGVLKSHSGGTTNLFNSSTYLNVIGTGSTAAGRYFNGKISNVSIFDEALTSTEVMKLYSNGMPQDLSTFTPAPVAWWTLGSNSFFNGSNFICKDLIGSNDGTSVNAGVDALQGNTPRSEANGTGTNMDIPTNLEGTTKYSSNNSWSINMSESARVADTP